MSIGSILLRVLLCLSLVLQGSQAAFAASEMAQPGSHVSHAAVPCHAMGKAGMAAHSAANMSAVHMLAGAGHPRPDCCRHASCNCERAQFAIADVRLHAVPPMALPPQRVILPMDDGHPAPVLPHLLRPPIG